MKRISPSFFHLKNKLIFVYSAVTLTVMLLLMVVIYLFVRQFVLHSVQESLKSQISAITTTIQTTADASIKSYFRSRTWAAVDFAEQCYALSQSGKISEEEAQNRVKAYVSSQRIGDTGYMTIASKDGLIVSHPFETVGTNVKSHPFVVEMFNSDENFIQYQWQNPLDDEPQDKSMYSKYFEPWNWYISTTAYDKELMSLVTIEDFEKNILTIPFGETGYPVVIGFDGTLLIHPKYKGVNMINRQDSMGDVTRKAISERNGMTTYYWKNPDETTYKKKITLYAEVVGFDMVVAATASESDFMKPLVKLQWLFFSTISVALVAVVLLTIRISHTITRPIISVKQWMQQATEGDLKVRSNLETEDEIGEIGSYFNNLMDTIERTQDQLIQEERFSSMGRLLSKIAHHLNTPIGSAITTASFLEHESEGIALAVSEKKLNQSKLTKFLSHVGESIGIINRSLSSAQTKIDSFKAFAVKTKDDMKWIEDLDSFIREQYLSLWRSRANEGITIELQCSEGLQLKTYPDLLILILNNLTDNSIKHGFKDSGTGKIKLQIEATEEQENVMFIYTDNGEGILKEHANRVFEPFYCPNSSFAASGMGLYAVYNAVVQIMQGTIRYEGDQATGVKYVICLPKTIKI